MRKSKNLIIKIHNISAMNMYVCVYTHGHIIYTGSYPISIGGSGVITIM